jgi:tetratricopeptide (TPR) repeat protein
MRRAVVLGVVVLALTGTACATWPPFGPAAPIMRRADRALGQGDYAGALAAYEEVLSKYPDERLALLARVNREAVVEILRVRQLLATREAEMARLREELARARQDLAGRQAELARLATEAERLRTDLEKLKQIDLQLEKRRP